MSFSPIRINFINQSSDSNNSTVVIFQKNVAMPSAPMVAWRVLHDTAGSEPYALTYSPDVYVSATDAQGMDTGRVAAQAQQTVVDHGMGVEIPVQEDAPLYTGATVEVTNGLSDGTLTIKLYRDDLVCAQATVAAGQTAKFDLRPVLWLGYASQLEEGNLLTPSLLSAINTELSLLQISSADLVMTGTDPNGQPIFDLTNIVRAV